ncbi:HEAT repeat domain-containing protein [Streptomyces sp. NPDC090798]|uniref:HEAT repeat domain-containing protein n=1 Tax=Streptomyces sp. NPDC090798 TaxID=3365968 RepID=UPI0038187319
MGEGGLDGRLVSAVRAGDAEAVRALLEQGADPEAVDAHGLPVLCVAAAAYDAPVAEALVTSGADPDRLLPEGDTPLRRAVDGGSPAVVSALLGEDPLKRLSEAARAGLLALARGWHETGAVEELRRRSGAPGPAGIVRVQDDEYNWVEQVSLGGLVVRAGHGAVLTSLEWAFRILPPVDELIDRAVRRPDENHVGWSTGRHVLCGRHSPEAWAAVLAHRHHPDPAHRSFAADYLAGRTLFSSGSGSDYYAKKAGPILAAWATEETDGEVLARVLYVFSHHDHPGQEAIALRHAGHPHPRVRRRASDILCGQDAPHPPAVRTALLTLARDPDPDVCVSACEVVAQWGDLAPEIAQALFALVQGPDAGFRADAAGVLAASRDRTAAVADALAALLDDADLRVRLAAASGLARRDDPRTEEAIERVGPLGPDFEYDRHAEALWRWKWHKEDSNAG